MYPTIGDFLTDIQQRSPRQLSSRDLAALGLLYETRIHADDALTLIAGLDEHDLLFLAKLRWNALEEER